MIIMSIVRKDIASSTCREGGTWY